MTRATRKKSRRRRGQRGGSPAVRCPRWAPGGRGVRESWPRSPGGSFASCSFGASPRNKPSREAIACVRDQLAFEQQLVQPARRIHPDTLRLGPVARLLSGRVREVIDDGGGDDR